MWTPLGTLEPRALVDARLSAHWAVQVPAAAAASLLPPRADFAHTNLGWDPGTEALLSHPLGPDGSVSAGLRLKDLTWIVAKDGGVVDACPVHGRTLAEGAAWFVETLTVAPFGLFEHDMPSHPVKGGAAFDTLGQVDVHAELAAWMSNASEVLGQQVRDENASAVRLWPHHFDIATLITLEHHEDPELARSVNVGFSLGDASYAEPYAYVSPWPYPADTGAAPALACGHWHTEGFFAAVLLGSTVTDANAEQEARALSFLREAVGHARNMSNGH